MFLEDFFEIPFFEEERSVCAYVSLEPIACRFFGEEADATHPSGLGIDTKAKLL